MDIKVTILCLVVIGLILLYVFSTKNGGSFDEGSVIWQILILVGAILAFLVGAGMMIYQWLI